MGKRLKDRESFSHLLELAARPMAVCSYEGNLEFSMEHIKQEYPSYGTGDMRYPAYEILQKNGSRISEFVYKEHQIYQGKPKLSGLPATYVEKETEATTLEIYQANPHLYSSPYPTLLHPPRDGKISHFLQLPKGFQK